MAAQQHWQSLIDNLPDIILTVDLNRRIDYINRTDSILEPEQVIGLHYMDFLQEPDRDRVALLIEQVYAGGEPQYIETEARSPEGGILGWYSARVGPLIRENRIEGVIIVSSNITERRQMDLALRQSRAQLRELTARQQTILEEERRRIARELHDELGQLLTALNIDLAWLERRLEEPVVATRLQSMKQIVGATMETIRRMTCSLRPPLLDDLGLAAAVDWLLQETCTRAGLHYRLSTSLCSQQLSEDCSLGIYRICQEALTNVVRHAQARNVELELRREGGRIILRIADDGIGIAPEKLNRSLGLLGMRERVDKLSGQLSIDCLPGKGTCISAELPAC